MRCYFCAKISCTCARCRHCNSKLRLALRNTEPCPFCGKRELEPVVPPPSVVNPRDPKEPFWLVFCPTGPTPPTKQHKTLTSAQTEAERLAGVYPGKKFYVMSSEGWYEEVTIPATKKVEYKRVRIT